MSKCLRNYPNGTVHVMGLGTRAQRTEESSAASRVDRPGEGARLILLSWRRWPRINWLRNGWLSIAFLSHTRSILQDGFGSATSAQLFNPSRSPYALIGMCASIRTYADDHVGVVRGPGEAHRLIAVCRLAAAQQPS